MIAENTEGLQKDQRGYKNKTKQSKKKNTLKNKASTSKCVVIYIQYLSCFNVFSFKVIVLVDFYVNVWFILIKQNDISVEYISIYSSNVFKAMVGN